LTPYIEKSTGFLLKGIVIATIVAMAFSCRNEMRDITAFDHSMDSLPAVSAYDIEFTYSDSARVQVRLLAPTMHNYDGEDSYMEFPDGFEVIFYDSLMNVTSRITANYGINYQERRLMEAHSDVVVNNYETDEQLNTEELIWDMRKEMIYSNKFVKITTGDGVLYGDGLESDQTFSSRRIINPSGEILIDEDNR
jgi:LPS export ABC transporter protein LptC